LIGDHLFGTKFRLFDLLSGKAMMETSGEPPNQPGLRMQQRCLSGSALVGRHSWISILDSIDTFSQPGAGPLD
jgi:hypothetical protein